MIKFHQLVWGLALAATALSLAACDDTTDNIGGSLIDNPDKLTVKADTFQLSTRTIMADSVIARNITGYLGRVKDPETGNYVTGDFMAQLHPLSNYQIAAADSILSRNDQGEIIADSCEILLVYNDFYVGRDADVTIVAGCGVHTETGEPARHSGIHRFFLEPGAHVKYVEKHIGTGGGPGLRSIDPVTEIYLERDAVLEMDTVQIGGVDRSTRKTSATVAAGAKLLIRERILTEGEQQADTEFQVTLDGAGAAADLISRAVARGASRQSYCSTMTGNAPCSGHSECDAIIDGTAVVDAAPKLCAHHADAAMIHEAAIGKIAGEQILKLRTLGLTEQEAEAKIIEGFLS